MRSTTVERMETAKGLRSEGRLTEALDTLTALDECNSQAWELRGEIEFELSRFQDAALSYSAVVSSEPNHVDAQYNFALCLQRAKRWAAASQAFERALSLDPEHDEARLGLGACLLQLGRLEEALATFEESRTGMEKGRVMFGRAVALQLLGRFDQARSAFESALTTDSIREEALSNLVAMAIALRDPQRVRDYSLRLQKVSPRSTVALRGLASVALDGRDNGAAARYCDRILEFDPGCLEAWHNLRIATDGMLSGFCEPQPSTSSILWGA